MEALLYRPMQKVAEVREFRLLKIHPGHGDELWCDLMPFKLHHSPPYTALSYTWKSAFDDDNTDAETSATEVIMVSGRQTTVGSSLASALRACRDWHGGADEFFWADAICIDQSSFSERAYQVAIMGEIYANATSVFVWLGPEAQDSDHAVSLLKTLAKWQRDPERRGAQTLAMARNPRFRRQWRALEALLRRRWWLRAWVLQETVLARRVEFYCGRATLSEDELFNGHTTVKEVWESLLQELQQRHGIQLPIPSHHALSGIQGLRAERMRGKVFSMLSCHHRTMSLRATNPRDYIFAKMGMALDGYLATPNYEDPVHTVYTKFVADYISATASLSIVHFDARPRNKPSLPSWVPDWECGFGASPLQPDPIAFPNATMRWYAASKNHAAEVAFEASEDESGQPDCRVLACKGYIVDAIDGVAFAEENTWVGTEAPRRMVQPRNHKHAYQHDEQLFEAMCTCLTLGHDHRGNHLPPEAYTSLANEFCSALARIQIQPGWNTRENVAGETSAAAATSVPALSRFEQACLRIHDFVVAGQTVAEHMRRAVALTVAAQQQQQRRQQEKKSDAPIPSPPTWDGDRVCGMPHALVFRRLLTTERGYVGTGPINAESGDVVSVLLGSNVPIILRPSSTEGQESTFSVVGAGDIPGIMYGEAVDRMQDEEVPLRTLRLV